MLSFQEMITTLGNYWASHGCAWHQGYDLEVGAGTFNPVTFLRCLGPEPYQAVYVEPSRRPQDGRYGQNPNRVQFYHQMQVIFKPSPYNIQELYLGSLEAIGLDLSKHDIRFVHDDWENPTIGASGLGWEIWIDGMEATQFTYFQSVGGLPVKPVTAEITYGLERLAMYLQGVNSIFDVQWTGDLSYGDIYQNSEWQWSYYNFEESDSAMWLRHFADFEEEAKRLIKKNLPIPAYDFVMKASHAFNMLDARGTISVSERARTMAKIRGLAHDLAIIYIQSREKAQFPLLKKNHVTEKPLSSSPTLSVNKSEKEDFLLEIGSEELPANAINGALFSLSTALRQLLTTNKVNFQTVEEYATPRRLAVLIRDVSTEITPKFIEKKGPKLDSAFDEKGMMTKAGQGFFRSLGLEEMALHEVIKSPHFFIRESNGSQYLYANVTTKGMTTRALLAENLEKIILAIEFPKKMRWADLAIEYGRPLRWCVALLGNEIIPFSIATFASGRDTMGHRLRANQSISLGSPSDYVTKLEKHFVLPSIAKRKECIIEQIEKMEQQMGLRALARETLLEEVVHLVEWPDVVLGNFDTLYLKAPKEVLVSEMIEHQRYFPLEDKDGKLVPHFLAISNNGSSELIAQGHRRAISSRLADGLFLYEEDLKQPLSYFAEKLANVTFQQELGSMATKQKRIGELALLLHSMAPIADKDSLLIAASLCKADLTTQLVNEFPHLQGIIGALYARHQNEDEDIAIAIEEHWLPKQEKGPLPSTGLGKLLSLADKLDNLLSCFSLGLRPTSSSDPFALRRQAFGFLKMIIEENLSLDFPLLLDKSFTLFLQNPELTKDLLPAKKEIIDELLLFFEGRLKTLFAQMGFAKEKIEAILSNGWHSPYISYRQLQALDAFAKQHETPFADLLGIYTRVKKILQSARGEFGEINERLVIEKEEKELFMALENLEKEKMEYGHALVSLANLQPLVSAFFDHIIVMTEQKDLSLNRLALLNRLLIHFEKLLDFSKL